MGVEPMAGLNYCSIQGKGTINMMNNINHLQRLA